MKSILDPKFQYTNAVSTDIRKTFARVRREMKLPEPLPKAVVVNIQERSKRK